MHSDLKSKAKENGGACRTSKGLATHTYTYSFQSKIYGNPFLLLNYPMLLVQTKLNVDQQVFCKYLIKCVESVLLLSQKGQINSTDNVNKNIYSDLAFQVDSKNKKLPQ